jgi:hypothetical protein
MRKSSFTEEQMVAVICETDRDGVPAVAKRHKVSEQTLYTWRKRSGAFQPDDGEITIQRGFLGSGGRERQRDGDRLRVSLNDPAKTTLDRYFLVGRTPAAIVVQVPAVSIGRMEGAGTTLTIVTRCSRSDGR